MTFAIQIVHFYYHFNSRALGRAARVLPPRRRCTEGHHTHAARNRRNIRLDIVPAKRVILYVRCYLLLAIVIGKIVGAIACHSFEQHRTTTVNYRSIFFYKKKKKNSQERNNNGRLTLISI